MYMGWSAPVEINNYNKISNRNRPNSSVANCGVCGYKTWLSEEDMAWICNQDDKCWGIIKWKNKTGGWLISKDSLGAQTTSNETDLYEKKTTTWRKANNPDTNVEGVLSNPTSRFTARDDSTIGDIVSLTPGLHYGGNTGYSKANSMDRYTIPIGWKFMISNDNIGQNEVEGYWDRGGPGKPGNYVLDNPTYHGMLNKDDTILVQNVGFDVGANWYNMDTLSNSDQRLIRSKWCQTYPSHTYCKTPYNYKTTDEPITWTTVTNFRHKAGMPYLCVINDGKADTQPTTKSACDTGFYCNICTTDLFCQRDADSIKLSYVPSSYANTDKYIPAAKVKGSSIRGSATPRCPDCQKEYSWVLGSCYEDCNITAGIASCVNGQVVKNTGKENLNYSMQSTGLCNLDCPSGYTDMGTYCTVKPETRGAGSALECSGRWQQYGLACYTPCNETAGIADWNGTSLVKKTGYDYVNYQMQTAGLCAQQCPAGSFDSGVFCNRQNYNRGVGKPKS
jgi:hypothetical protein